MNHPCCFLVAPAVPSWTPRSFNPGFRQTKFQRPHRSSPILQMEYALGFDFGTSAARAAVIYRDPSTPSSCEVIYQSSAASFSSAKQSVQEWTDSLQELLHEIPSDIRQKVSTISIDGTSATSIHVNKDLVLMYNEQVPGTVLDRIRKYSPPTSSVLASSSSLAKFVFWLEQQHESDSPLVFCHQTDLLLHLLMGLDPKTDPITSDYNNSLKLGFDSALERYPEFIADMIEVESILTRKKYRLPRVVPPGTVIGNVRAQSKFHGLLQPQCKVVAGTTDSIAAFIASGASELGDACSSLGSTLAIKLLSRTPVDVPKFGIYSHYFPSVGRQTSKEKLWLVGGASNTGCRILRDLKFSPDELQALSSQVDPWSESPTDYYPLPLNAKGERFPENNPDKVCTVDLNEPSRLRLLHGIFQGVAKTEAQGYQRLGELGAQPARPTRLFSSGGASINPIWTRIRSKYIYGDPESQKMTKAKFTEACIGAAILAGSAIS